MSKTVSEISQEDCELLNQINQRPDIKARFLSILKIARSECEHCETASQAEDTLTDNLRLLGNEVLKNWANATEKRIVRKVKEEHPQYKIREKKMS